mmetsp:Transcript_2780/g.4022  ORF Transcript_2780/g.4022 Transcript_2780/m.4022 type:complete len:235 (+) Transcript_2780:895-1599(+)
MKTIDAETGVFTLQNSASPVSSLFSNKSIMYRTSTKLLATFPTNISTSFIASFTNLTPIMICYFQLVISPAMAITLSRLVCFVAYLKPCRDPSNLTHPRCPLPRHPLLSFFHCVLLLPPLPKNLDLRCHSFQVHRVVLPRKTIPSRNSCAIGAPSLTKLTAGHLHLRHAPVVQNRANPKNHLLLHPTLLQSHWKAYHRLLLKQTIIQLIQKQMYPRQTNAAKPCSAANLLIYAK